MFLQLFGSFDKIDKISMPFHPGFARQTLLPLAVHAYGEAGLPEDCDSLDTKVFNIVGKIEVDPAKCMQVWSRHTFCRNGWTTRTYR